MLDEDKFQLLVYSTLHLFKLLRQTWHLIPILPIFLIYWSIVLVKIKSAGFKVWSLVVLVVNKDFYFRDLSSKQLAYLTNMTQSLLFHHSPALTYCLNCMVQMSSLAYQYLFWPRVPLFQHSILQLPCIPIPFLLSLRCACIGLGVAGPLAQIRPVMGGFFFHYPRRRMGFEKSAHLWADAEYPSMRGG